MNELNEQTNIERMIYEVRRKQVMLIVMYLLSNVMVIW